MIQDVNNTLGEAQALTATADSTNIIDFGSAGRDLTAVDDLWLVIKVDGTAFAAAGAATLDIDWKQSDDSAFGSGVSDIPLARAIPKATLVAGYTAIQIHMPGNCPGRYGKVAYTVNTGPFTAGTISAFLTESVQHWLAGKAPNQA